MASAVTVKHDASFKTILLYPGMPVEEIKAVVCAAFGLPAANIVGVTDPEEDVNFPIALLSRAPAFFSSKAFELSLLPEDVEEGDDEGATSDDEDDDEDEDEDDIDQEEGYEESTKSRVEDGGRVGEVLFSLSDQQLEQLMECFHRSASNGNLDRRSFEGVFEMVLGSSRNSYTRIEMRKVLSQLFNIFDRDKNGLVSTLEFQTGLSVLGKGRLGGESPAIRRAFEAFDLDGNGYVSLGEMVRYLTSVFVVVAEQKPEVFEANQVTPAELAEATAKRCFEEAGLGKDGRLTFDQFRRWYTSSNSDAIRQFEKTPVQLKPSLGTELPSLATLRVATGLGNMSPAAVLEHFKKHVTKGAPITRTDFDRCLLSLRPHASFKSPDDFLEHRRLMDHVFSLFDSNGDGVVDFAELTSGLSVLCGGQHDDKVRAAFNLFDSSGDGFISKDEMETYLTSVFRVLYETSAETRESSSVSPEVLAHATTEQCFCDADINGDGLLSFEEFKEWFSRSNHGSEDSKAVPVLPALPSSMEELCRLTNLRSYDVADLVLLFEDFAARGGLDFATFCDAFAALRDGAGLSPQDEAKAQACTEMLFTIFDVDGNGVVDQAEMLSGISVLCRGPHKDRARAAFDLYDVNGDGFISLDEMTRYLRSVYRLLYQMKPEVVQQMKGVGPDDLAIVTAQQAFEENDLTHEGKLSFDEFSSWYSSGGGAVDEAHEVASKLEEVKELTNLAAYDIKTLVNFFKGCASPEGLSKDSFFDCFSLLVQRNLEGQPQEAMDWLHINSLIGFLFRLFDTDSNGVVDMPELVAGLSVLSGGSRDSKVQAAFAMYDEDSDGFISLQEMTAYLNTVFKMLLDSSPSARQAMSVSPRKLASVTAKQCFRDAGIPSDGLLSFNEFRLWYSKNAPPEPEKLTSPSTSNAPALSLTDMSALTGLGTHHVDDVLQLLAHCADSEGLLSRVAFTSCFHALVGEGVSSPDAREVIQHLFDIFAEGDVASFDRAASGLSVLCGGTHKEKVQAAFNLFDLAASGFIARDEVLTYMTAVYSILFAASPDAEARLGVTAGELAQVTTAEAFEQAGGHLSADGLLSFDGFALWCSNDRGPEKEVESDTTSTHVSLQEISTATGFTSMDVDVMFERFAQVAADNGTIGRKEFGEVLKASIANSGAELGTGATDRLVAELFEVFDANGDGFVDFAELMSGLSVLCGGSREDKARASFNLFDTSGDGFISKDDMVTYLTSIFKLIFATKPELYDTMGVGPAEFGLATADQAFADSEVKNGQISFQEFQQWHVGGALSTPELAPQHPSPAGSAIKNTDMSRARWLLNLDKHSVNDLLDTLVEAAPGGMLSRQQFRNAMLLMVRLGGNLIPQTAEYREALEMIEKVYDEFDTQKCDQVDVSHLTGGLSTLCNVAMDDKIDFAFALYDIRGMGFVPYSELVEYTASVFKVLFAASPGLKVVLSGQMKADALAYATVAQAFEEAGLDSSSNLNKESFKSFVGRGLGL